MRPKKVFGIDIGGANLKLSRLVVEDSTGSGESVLIPFRKRENLMEILLHYVREPDLVVVTETACANRSFFRSARQGVLYITNLAARLFDNEKVRFVCLGYRLSDRDEVQRQYLQFACRNWVATTFLVVTQLGIKNGILIDCGTSSTDIVPIVKSKPLLLRETIDRGFTRLATGEIVWSGLFGTPLPAISNIVRFEEDEYLINANTPARSADVYITLKAIEPEDVSWKTRIGDTVHHFDTPHSFELSVTRILNTIAADRELLSEKDAVEIASFFAEKQRSRITSAISKVTESAQEKLGIKLHKAVLVGKGKDIILKPAVQDCGFEEVIDIEKYFSDHDELLGAKIYVPNCETSIGCALLGLDYLTKNRNEVKSSPC